MRYYSDITGSVYNTELELFEAERESMERENKRKEAEKANKADREKVDAAWKNLAEARKAYFAALKEYGEKHPDSMNIGYLFDSIFM